MLDLSEEYDEENIATCARYFKRMSAVNLWLEMEIGITGGEEDGVDNSAVKAESLYTKPEQVYEVYKALSPISPMFSIAAAFGNVHGVYKSGNVVLSPHVLAGHQVQVMVFFGVTGTGQTVGVHVYPPNFRMKSEEYLRLLQEEFFPQLRR